MATSTRAVLLLALTHAPAVVAQMFQLRRGAPPPNQEHPEPAEVAHLLEGVEEDELCSGNEAYCTEGTEYHAWVSENCPQTCAIFLDEDRTGNMRADCEQYVGHCPKDDADGIWVRSYCPRTCARDMEERRKQPSAVSELMAENPGPVIGIAFLVLATYIRKLLNTTKVHHL